MSTSESFENFTTKVAELLMVAREDLVGDGLQDLPEYDSLARINIGLLIQEEYDYEVALDDLNSVETLRALYDLIKANIGD